VSAFVSEASEELQAPVVHIRTRSAGTLRPSSYARGQNKTCLFCLSDWTRCAWELRSNNKGFLAGIFSGDIHPPNNLASERFQPHKCWTNARTTLCKNSLRTPRYWTILPIAVGSTGLSSMRANCIDVKRSFCMLRKRTALSQGVLVLMVVSRSRSRALSLCFVICGVGVCSLGFLVYTLFFSSATCDMHV
jgi:hypothetical protein